MISERRTPAWYVTLRCGSRSAVRVAVLLGASSLAAVASCGGEGNKLSGSIGESFSLGFDTVHIRKQADALIIEYVKDVSGYPNKICKVVVDTRGLDLGDGTRLRGDVFKSHVQVSRVAGSGGEFPGVDHGEIKFGKFELAAGGEVDGGFGVVFENGRTLDGSFSGAVEEVQLD